jgi:hypothetical protein
VSRCMPRPSEFGGNGWYRTEGENKRRYADRKRTEERLERERHPESPYTGRKKPY